MTWKLVLIGELVCFAAFLEAAYRAPTLDGEECPDDIDP